MCVGCRLGCRATAVVEAKAKRKRNVERSCHTGNFVLKTKTKGFEIMIDDAYRTVLMIMFDTI